MSDTILSVSLSAERLRLETVAITVSREDPAYAIIRKAIERRGDHLEAERDYSVNVYIKSMQRMDDAPEKFLDMDVGRALEPGHEGSRSGKDRGLRRACQRVLSEQVGREP